MAESAEDQAALWALTIGFDKYAYRALDDIDDRLQDLEAALVMQLTRFFKDFDDDDEITAQTVAYLLYSLREVLSEAAKLDDVIAEAFDGQAGDIANEAVEDLQRHVDYLADTSINVFDIAVIAAVVDDVRQAAAQRAAMYATSHPTQLLGAIRSSIADGIGRRLDAFRSSVKATMPTVFRAARSRADNLVTTEAAVAYGAAYKDSAVALAASGALPDNVTVYYRWDAIRDRKTCALCRALDGKIVGNGESYDAVHRGEYESYMHPPAHNRCRCTLFITFSRDEADTRDTTR